MNISNKDFQYNLKKGKALFNEGDIDGSLELIEKALTLNPKSEEAILEMGKIYFSKSDLKRAARQYSKLIRLNNNSPIPLMELGKICLMQNKLKEAKQHLRLAAKFSQDSSQKSEIFIGLGKIYFSETEYKQSELMYRKAVKLNKDAFAPRVALGKIYIKQKNFKDAREHLQYVVDHSSDNKYRAEAFFGLGKIRFHKSKYKESVRMFKKAINLEKNDFSSHLWLGKVFLLQKKLIEARQHLNYVAEQSRDSFQKSEAFGELGKIFFLNSDYGQAELMYSKAVDLNEKSLLSRLELAKIFILKGKLKEAKRELNYISENSRDPVQKSEALRELGKIHRLYETKEDERELKKVLKGFSETLPAVEADLQNSLERAKIYRRTNSPGKAAKIFKKLLTQKNVREDKFLQNKILNELEITEKKEVLESKTRSMVAMILDRCNIKCRICEIWKSKWQASPRTIKEIIELFPYMEDINWEGGEVFMMDGFEDILTEGGKYKNLRQVIYTNGLMINEKILNKIQNIRAEIVFSIDSAEKDTYEYIRRGASFQRLKKVLSLLREFRANIKNDKLKIYFNPVIMKSNYKEIMKLVEFAHRYGFDAVTFNPLRGDYGEENIFANKDVRALNYIEKNMPKVKERANELGIRLNDWLPVESCCCEEDDISNSESEEKEVEEEGKKEQESKTDNPDSKNLICYAPWQRMVLDNMGNVRPHVFCLNKWVGNSDEMSLSDIWNGAGMREYRRKIASGNFKDICQPECINGQVRENTREIN